MSLRGMSAWDEPAYEYFDVCAKCGYMTQNRTDMVIHCQDVHEAEGGASYSVEPVQTGSIHHEAVIETVHHPAEIVHHEAEVIHHPAEVIHHEAETHTVTRCTSCGAVK